MNTAEFEAQTGRFRVEDDFIEHKLLVGFCLRDTLTGEIIGSDCGKLEDQTLVRNLSWVREALNAVDAERLEAIKRAETAEKRAAALESALRDAKREIYRGAYDDASEIVRDALRDHSAGL